MTRPVKYPYYYATVTIPATPTAGLSDALDCKNMVPAAVVIPAAFTGGSITFQGSHDNENFYDLWSGGSEVTITGVVAGQMIALNLDDFDAVRALKIRSGVSATPIYEAAARTLAVVLRP